MIPKVIHYCWFGRKPLPKKARKCIESWKKHLPDYEIKEWNEDNFDVNCIPYTQEAYQAKRYAFVSDYARFYILYRYGGIYFDTDVEVLRSIDDIIVHGAFMGNEAIVQKDIPICINPGLGMGCEANNTVLESIIDYYSTMHFVDADGKQNLQTIVQYTTEILYKFGLKKQDSIQCVGGFRIYPKEYFNPYDCVLEKMVITNNTRTIHHFAGSWRTPKERFMSFVEKKLGRTGVRFIHRLKVAIYGK